MSAHIEDDDRELAALIQMRDEDIDTSDIPEVKDWSRAVVGKFYRPMKAPVTLRVDMDVLVWLKSEGRGYQTRINDLLRAAMQHSGSAERTSPPELELSDLRFPSLEKNGELEQCNRLAEAIENRHCLFAPTV